MDTDPTVDHDARTLELAADVTAKAAAWRKASEVNEAARVAYRTSQNALQAHEDAHTTAQALLTKHLHGPVEDGTL